MIKIGYLVKLPTISSFIMSAGSYYEMINTHTLHYVRPLEKPSISLMITGPFYPEAEFRKEVLDRYKKKTNFRVLKPKI